ncbi:MAG: hypothetical protein IPG24_22145 [Leptospiraceae bacterium]|nr:hypothetical protein [Leptospiraceae bacterium]
MYFISFLLIVFSSFFPMAIVGMPMLFGTNGIGFNYYGYSDYSTEIKKASMILDYSDSELINEASSLGYKKIYKLEGLDWRVIEVNKK